MKKYQSKIDYSKNYNSKLSTFQINKILHSELKDYCKLNNLKLKDFLENLISNAIKND